MKKCIWSVLILTSVSSHAQGVVGGVQSKGMDMNPQAFGFVTEIRVDTKETRGSTYLYDEWFIGAIDFVNGGTVIDKPLRYNIELNLLEMNINGIRKGAKVDYVKSFEIFNSASQQKEKYVNATGFKTETGALTGVLREIVNGKYSLYSKTDVKLIKGVYVAALDMGDPDDQLSKKTTYLLKHNDNLMELTLNKKQFSHTITGHETAVLQYIKVNKINLKQEEDLLRIMQYVNDLTD